jgi:FkbM family methyltransferase
MAYDLFQVFKNLQLTPSNLVLVGAWEGGEVRGFLEAGIQGAYLFEAEPSAIELLKKNYGSETRVTIFEGAVASVSGKSVNFHVLNHGSSSLLTPDLNQLNNILPDFEIQREIEVNTITLDSSLRNYWNGWSKNKLETLLILDIQGGELEALKGAPELLERVGWIQSEVSTAELYQNQNTLSELDEFLEAAGFNRVSVRVYPRRKHGDALYFRPDLIDKSFVRKTKIEDLHWNLARKKPAWIPSLSQSKPGRFVLKLIYRSQ